MSVAEAPQPAAASPAATPTAAPPRAVRLPGWADSVASPAIALLTAALVVATSAGGNSVAGVTRAEILVCLGGGALLVAALLRPGASRIPGGWATGAFLALAALAAVSI